MLMILAKNNLEIILKSSIFQVCKMLESNLKYKIKNKDSEKAIILP